MVYYAPYARRLTRGSLGCVFKICIVQHFGTGSCQQKRDR